MQPHFPERSAGALTLPDGSTVWVKTLNRLQREEAREEAELFAQTRVRRYRPGNFGHEAVIDALNALTPEEQAVFLADTLFVIGDGEQRAANPPRDRTGAEADSAGAAEASVSAAAERESGPGRRTCSDGAIPCSAHAGGDLASRREAVYAAERKRALALSPDARMAECRGAFVHRKLQETFVARISDETLVRAVRRPDDRSRRRFLTADQVADLDDDARAALIAFYRELEVAGAEVPTSPAASTGRRAQRSGSAAILSTPD